MSGWLNWRTWVAALILAAVFSGVLFLATEEQFTLSGLDLFFMGTTIVSLGFNLSQVLRDRFKYQPLKNSLIGLFNDLKARQLRAHQRQTLINTRQGAELDAQAIRMQFSDYLQENVQNLGELREHVVAAIHTLDPDISNRQIFRASDFGLTDQERDFQNRAMEQFHNDAINAHQHAGNPGNEGPER